MQPLILTISNPELDLSNLRRTLHIKADTQLPADLNSMIEEAKSIAVPKASYKVAYIDSRFEKGISLDGISFHSRILKTNLEPVYRAFPYIATAGIELYEWSSQFSDLLLRFWADSIQEQYLTLVRRYLHDELISQYQISRISSMNPGSLADFPITEQTALFRLLGDPARDIGVSLTESLLMLPIKSVSGIFFASEFDFSSCMLCPRENCQGRISPFDPRLYAQRFHR